MKKIIVLITCAVLAGCGFHFRAQPLVPQHVQQMAFKSKTPYAPFELQLKRKLQAQNVQLAEDAGVVIHVLDSETSQGARAITGDKRLDEIEVTYTVEFQVLNQDGKVLIQPSELSRSESLLYDRNFVLGKAEEIGLLEQELAEALAEEVLYRLSLIKQG